MGQQAVIRHADAPRERDVVGHKKYTEARPREIEERPDGADMKKDHEKRGDPRYLAVLLSFG
jgi:hypothetical protein